MKKTIVCVFILMLTGCASSGAPFKHVDGVSKDKAIVYIYRPSCMPILRKPDVYLNDKKILELANETYFPLILNEGRYMIKVDWPDDTFIKDAGADLSVVAGKTYYLRVASGGSLGNTYFIGGTPIVTMNSNPMLYIEEESRALEEIKSCTLLGS